MTAIHDKIRKLLALAQGNANENESDSAMRMATALMARHGIEQRELGVKSTGPVEGPRFAMGKPYIMTLVSAAAHLYGCKVILEGNRAHFWFIGRPENNDAAQDTLAFLIAQLEHLYRVGLPAGMSRQARSVYRRSFKLACAARVNTRCHEIVEALSSRDDKAAGTQALVVLGHFKQLTLENDQFLAELKVGKARASRVKHKVNSAYLAGLTAGDLVQINQTVEK